MKEMGGLRKKMPVTAYTMLIGCLAVTGINVIVVGFSGYYSKDRILEQAYVFMGENEHFLANVFFVAAAGGAAITAFYMFRMWYMTFAGKPRDEHRYEHAHESPKVMTIPLIVLAFFATTVAWTPFSSLGKLSQLNAVNLLEQSRPLGTLTDTTGVLTQFVWKNEHFAHAPEQYARVVLPVTLIALAASLSGIALATVMYCFGKLDPGEVRRQFQPIYRLLWNKWWFDELYHMVFVRPTLLVSRWCAVFDRRWIDGFLDGTASAFRWFARAWDWFADRVVVDGSINGLARRTFALGIWLRVWQTGHLRQYVMFIVIGAIALFVLVSFFWNPTATG
jgi:NADH-quinone oxidoreductase subunit L